MDRRRKEELRKYIDQSIDLAGVRLKDTEAEYLASICSRGDELNGLTREKSRRHVGWCSDGKYTRDECSVYTIVFDARGFRIEEHYECHDDDGYSDLSDVSHTGARDIMRLLNGVFGI